MSQNIGNRVIKTFKNLKHTNIYMQCEQRVIEATNMPKTQKQTRGEIIHDLYQYGKNPIPQADFLEILSDHNVTHNTAIKGYTEKLVKENYLKRVEGGFRLTDESRKDGIITIWVRPSQNTKAVRDSLPAALQQFYPLATVEEER